MCGIVPDISDRIPCGCRTCTWRARHQAELPAQCSSFEILLPRVTTGSLQTGLQVSQGAARPRAADTTMCPAACSCIQTRHTVYQAQHQITTRTCSQEGCVALRGERARLFIWILCQRAPLRQTRCPCHPVQGPGSSQSPVCRLERPLPASLGLPAPGATSFCPRRS